MIAAFILAPLTLVLGALFLVGQSRYGHLRLSEWPGALWILLAGPDERRQLRGILGRRVERHDLDFEKAWVRVGVKVDGHVIAVPDPPPPPRFLGAELVPRKGWHYHECVKHHEWCYGLGDWACWACTAEARMEQTRQAGYDEFRRASRVSIDLARAVDADTTPMTRYLWLQNLKGDIKAMGNFMDAWTDDDRALFRTLNEEADRLTPMVQNYAP